ncbi:MAG: glycosyltransferase family 39 protein [Gammaproteobacteria bacterium]|nr:glycosyltransferase family 39 protein [Gammaproteobacteria bacterium]
MSDERDDFTLASPSAGRGALALVALLAAAAALRLPGMLTDFWLDEIWSLQIARIATSIADIFTLFPGSDNQHLNSIVLHLMGDHAAWPWYRVHSLAGGVGAVALAWIIGRRRGELEGWLAGGLVGGSYLMVHYSSEARGYALVVLFALATYHGATRYVETRRRGWLALVWASAALGFLAHLTYLHVFNALGAWLLARIWLGDDRRGAVRDLVACLGVPALALGVFYVLVIRHFVVGAAPPYDAVEIIVKTLSYTGGGPPRGVLALVAAGIVGVMLCVALTRMARRGDDRWVFFAVVTVVSPLAVLLAMRPDVLFVRYFLLGVVFAYLAIAFELAGWLRGPRPWRALALALLAGYAAGNAVDIAGFYRHGRGGYLEGLGFVVERSREVPILVASDYDFRNELVIDFYRRYLPADKPIVYVDDERLAATLPEWYLVHRIGPREAMPAEVAHPSGRRFELEREIPYADLSGWHWYLYHRRETP